MNLEDVIRKHILYALRVHKGNRTHAAKALGISVRTMSTRLAQYQAEGFDVMKTVQRPKG